MTNKKYCIYRHIRLDINQVFYVGIGSVKRSHEKRSRSDFWYNIVNQTGYEIQILKQDLTWKDACELEIALVAYYGRRDKGLGPLVNLTDGGDGSVGVIVNEITRKKLSIAGKNRKLSSEHKRKIGEASAKRTHSEFSKEKIRQSNIGKIISEEEKQRLRTLGLGRIKSDEERLKLSLAHKGKKKSAEHCRQISLTHPGKKKVICTISNKEWNSVRECAEENNTCRYCLARKLRGGVKNNTTFKYIDNAI